MKNLKCADKLTGGEYMLEAFKIQRDQGDLLFLVTEFGETTEILNGKAIRGQAAPNTSYGCYKSEMMIETAKLGDQHKYSYTNYALDNGKLIISGTTIRPNDDGEGGEIVPIDQVCEEQVSE